MWAKALYSPKGHLYALDFAWGTPDEAGLYRLDSEGKGKDQEITAKLIVGLKKPAAMAFGDDGSLYIAVFGETEGDGEDADKEKATSGQVIKLEPGL